MAVAGTLTCITLAQCTPDDAAYLAYILITMPHDEDRISTSLVVFSRTMPVSSSALLQESSHARYVKQSLLHAFDDPSLMIRSATGQDIVAFLGTLEPKNWPRTGQSVSSSSSIPRL
jgi:transportin-1